MSELPSIHLKRLHGQLGEAVYQLTKVQFFQCAPPQTWTPVLNIYRCENCIVVCAELAGVEKSAIELRVEPRRLLISGRREAPEPEERDHKPMQVLAMEIDYGSFQREVIFPLDVETERVNAEQKNGLLWIYLPLRSEG
jgi:HSP20 family protein